MAHKMKIEIDFSKPESLRKQKRELEMALATINGALTAMGKIESDVDHPTFPQIKEVQANLTVNGVDELIAALPSQFNMRQAKEVADAAEIPDSRLRREIARLTESGALIMIEKGQGRRPASFRKK